MRELDERSQGLMNQTREQTNYFLGQSSKRGYQEEDETMEKEIESNALSLCTEKVLLARQAYDLIDSHVKRLDEDLNNFSEDLNQEGKIAPDEPAILPPLPLVPKDEKKKSYYAPSHSKKFDYRDWDW
ncbi:PHD finger protein ing2 [Ranunculus cassubicifolius]